jgi:sialate O-acetylesterase
VKNINLLAILLLAGFAGNANIRLPRIFNNHMVLQRGTVNQIWGWADARERISISFAGKTIKVRAGKNGEWKARLPVMEYGGPYVLRLKGKNEIELKDVMIGEVWVCSGQSNMEMMVRAAKNSQAEIAAAQYPAIRLFTVPKKVAKFPQDDLDKGEWVECAPGTVGSFSAAAYYFGRYLCNELKVPIGLIHSSWGGTVAETWISGSTMEKDEDFVKRLQRLKATDSIKANWPNDFPTLLYNGMIHPLIPYGIKGVIWYQGEGNRDRAWQYRHLFPSLINDWREKWHRDTFPFLFVSLANYLQPVDTPAASKWAELREAQAMTLSVPQTGMAVAIDLGEAGDIHPKNKQEVGRRLALNALKIAYGRSLVYSGPLYDAFETAGGAIKIRFNHTGGGLAVKNGDPLKGFAIAGEDRQFYWAEAELVNDSTILVHADKVPHPVAVRYGWADNPDTINLYNKEGLPAHPFRTDEWPGITVGKK